MRPLIGIPPCLDESGRWRPGREYHYIDASYARAIHEAGGIPLYLPEAADPAAAVQRLDGLLVPGGDDFAPPTPYPPEVAFELAPRRQVDFDRALLAAALARPLPVLGICYGMQLLALHCGGSLHYDLATDQPSSGPHQFDSPEQRHEIAVEPGTALGALLGRAATAVNSRHHQAVAEPGSARISARADDGVVEAIEVAEARFALGVQWHPETLEPAHRRALFGAFVAACRGEAPAGGGARSTGY
ncbi:MAG: gamma-glutamyl-gamma-aminobutyrate hydrolase family protein [Myxococcota bacterium]